MKFKYKVVVGFAKTYCENGIDLDWFVMDILRRGVKMENIKITIVSIEDF